MLAEPAFVEIQENPAAGIERIDQRHGRVRLPEQVPEVRIGGEDRDLVEDGFAPRRLHRLGRGLVPLVKERPDVGVGDARQTLLTKGGISEEWWQLDERQLALGQRQQTVAQQLLGACPERVETPA